jgi:hypothetical protein
MYSVTWMEVTACDHRAQGDYSARWQSFKYDPRAFKPTARRLSSSGDVTRVLLGPDCTAYR